ncbi:MAG: DUF4013 domain-containing protein [Halobacteriales archaeon]|nr:DUF4013 domain-containing protein [Halobacteriales archaeon]
MLSEALEFPRRGDDWLQTVLIGGVLSILSFLVIPAILVNGYLVRTLRAAVEGESNPPAFDEWGDMLVDGVLVWVIELVYVGIPAFLMVVVVSSFVLVAGVSTSMGATPEPGAGALVGGIVAVLFLLAVVVLLLVAAYLLPAALANFARTGEFAAAFHLRTIGQATLNVDYLVAVVLAIGVSIVLGTVGAMLSVILVGIFVLFYLQVVVYHLFGQGFARGLDLERTADGATAD